MVAANWAGFYLGGNFGSGTGRDRSSFVGSGANEFFNLAPDGINGGVQAGYNWQAGHWVFGVEADIQGADLHDNYTCVSSCLPTRAITFDQRIDWFGTARGRLGYASGPVLTYVTGGLAYANVKDTIANTFIPAFGGIALPLTTATAVNQEVRTGYAIGSGVEASLGGNWTGKIEYLYLDLGSRSTTIGANTFGFEYREHIFRGGLNYRIGAPDARVAAAAMNWSGFYLGANAGYGWGHSDEFAAFFGTRANFDISGGLAGGQVGYNWQAGAWVFGVEADGDWADIDGSVRCPNPAFSCTAKLRDLASFRGRVGWATGPALLYATGGLGYANVRYSTLTAAGGMPGPGMTGVYTADRWGYAVGAGLEYGFAPNWSAKLEYMHYGFDDITSPGLHRRLRLPADPSHRRMS